MATEFRKCTINTMIEGSADTSVTVSTRTTWVLALMAVYHQVIWGPYSRRQHPIPWTHPTLTGEVSSVSAS